MQVLGASSDHLILDVHDLPEAPALGEAIVFVPNYAATLALFTSPYVAKEFVGGADGYIAIGNAPWGTRGVVGRTGLRNAFA